jgi:hypothetical protein
MFDVPPTCYDGVSAWNDPLVLIAYAILQLGWDHRAPANPLPKHRCANSKMILAPDWMPGKSTILQGDSTWGYTGDELYDTLACLACASVAISLSFVTLRHAWSRIDPNFRAINPPHKQMYVVANVMKSFMLGAFVFSYRWWFGSLDAFFNDDYLSLESKRIGVLYVVTDLIALLMVPKLPASTKMHHYAALLMTLGLAAFDLSLPGYVGNIGVAKMIIIYGQFSSLAFLVNLFLALRVVYPDALITRLAAVVSLWTYMLCCAGNWGVHIWWLIHCFREEGGFTILSLLYIPGLLFVGNDDIVLMKWLYHYQQAETLRVKEKRV